MQNVRLPDFDIQGFKTFPFQLALDEAKTPVIVSNDVIQMYMGYCIQCKMRNAQPRNFYGWLHEGDGSAADETVDPGADL